MTTVAPPGPTARVVPSADPKTLLAAALAALKRRDIAACAALLERAAAVAPRDPNLSALLGDVLLRHGDPVAARRHLQTSLRLAPNQAPVLLNLATAELQLGQHAGAISILRRILSLDPGNIPALRLAADAHLAMGLHAEATDFARALVRLTPAGAEAHGVLGQALLQAESLDEAAAVLRQALDLDPSSRHARLGLATIEAKRDLRAQQHSSGFAQYRAAAFGAPVTRPVALRRGWMEFRQLFNSLLNDPIWDAQLPTVDAWTSSTVRRSRFGGLMSAVADLDDSPRANLPPELSLREAFRTLETWHDWLAQELAAAVTTESRSWAGSPAQCGALPADYARKREVDALRRELTRAPVAIDAAMLHGSLADGRVASGFSDADVLCFIARPQPGGEFFWQAAQWLFRLNHRLYAINPCMHHGPMLAFVAEVAFAAEATLPSAIVRNGVWLKGGHREARYHDGIIEAVLGLEMFESYFARTHLVVADLRHAFDVLWWTSSALLLPLLLEQAETGHSVYKRTCFEQRQAALSTGQWATLEGVSAVRRDLGTWLAARLGAGEALDEARNPGRVLAEQRSALALSPAEVRQLGVSDALMREVRELWNDVARRVLNLGFRHLGAATAIESKPLAWMRPVERWPVRLTLTDYDAARQAFLERCGARPEVRAVFEFGEVGCPGLSDLDFCVVLNDTALGVPEELRTDAFPPEVAYVMGHDALFVSAAMLVELPALFPIFQSNQIFGAPLMMPVSETFSIAVRAAASTYKQLVKYPEDLDGLLRQPVLDVRTVLAFLHSAQHVQRCLRFLGCSIPPSVTAAVDLDDTFRGRWVAGGAFDRQDVFSALEASLRMCAPLRQVLVGHWLKMASGIECNRDCEVAGRAGGDEWLLAELGLDPALRHDDSGAPTLTPILWEYHLIKRRFLDFERRRGREPSSYIEQRRSRRPAVAAPRVLRSRRARRTMLAPILFAKTDALGDQVLATGLVRELLHAFPGRRLIWLVRTGIHAVAELLEGAQVWWVNPHAAPYEEAARCLASNAGMATPWSQVTILPVSLQPYAGIPAQADAVVQWWAQFVEALTPEVAIAGAATVNWVDQLLVGASSAPRRYGFALSGESDVLTPGLLRFLSRVGAPPFTAEAAFATNTDEVGHTEALAAVVLGRAMTLLPTIAPAEVEIPPELARRLATGLLVAPGAGDWRRSLPAATTADAVAAFFRTQTEAGVRDCLLLEGLSDRKLVQELASELSARHVAFSIVPVGIDGGLRSLVAILRQTRVLLCNDTVYAHLAALVGTPTVAVWGQGHGVRFMPRAGAMTIVHAEVACAGCGWDCCFERWQCVSLIPATVVAEAVQRRAADGARAMREIVTVRGLVSPDAIEAARRQRQGER